MTTGTARATEAQTFNVDINELRSSRAKLSAAIDDDANAADMSRACQEHRTDILKAVGRHPSGGKIEAALKNGLGGTALNLIDGILQGTSL